MNLASIAPGPSQTQRVSEAFSRQSSVFDSLDEEPLIQWVRGRVREATLKWARPGARMLEINCGTGIDSLWMARMGLQVTATDIAPGMLAELRRKLEHSPDLDLRVYEHSFLQLEAFPETAFDVVFSNFGGINCTDDLPLVLRGVDAKLRSGGVCVLVIMPRFSPWELLDVLRGRFRGALRRYRPKGAVAVVEGTTFHCWYHEARAVRRLLPAYQVLDRMALSFFVPPPHLAPFARRQQRLTTLMKRLENMTCRWPFIRSRGDHYLIVLKKP